MSYLAKIKPIPGSITVDVEFKGGFGHIYPAKRDVNGVFALILNESNSGIR